MSTVTTINDDKVNFTLTCLTDQQKGYASTVTYYVSYKKSSDATWSNTTVTSCGSIFELPGLEAVSTYTFAAYATNDYGQGPMTSVSDYKTATTYGTPTTPGRPTLTQNNDKTVTITWPRSNPLNDEAGTSLNYTVQVLKNGFSDWNTATNYNASLPVIQSANANPSVTYSMDLLKETAGYTETENGDAIKVRITATSIKSYGTSSASEENSPSAVYQGKP